MPTLSNSVKEKEPLDEQKIATNPTDDMDDSNDVNIAPNNGITSRAADVAEDFAENSNDPPLDIFIDPQKLCVSTAPLQSIVV